MRRTLTLSHPAPSLMRHLKMGDCHSLKFTYQKSCLNYGCPRAPRRPAQFEKTRFEKLKLEMSDSSAHEDAQKTAKRAFWASSVFLCPDRL